jgi:polyhydroxyalkanoate synthesis regulator phasin
VNQIDGLKRYIEAATTLTQITRGRAEEIVRDLVSSGELERTRAQEWIEDLVKRSREASEHFVDQVSSEVDRQLSERGLKGIDIEDLAHKVAGVIELAGVVGRSVASPAARRAREEDAHGHRQNGKKSSAGKTAQKRAGQNRTGQNKTAQNKGAESKVSQKSKASGGKASAKSADGGMSAKRKAGGPTAPSKKGTSGKKGPKETRPKNSDPEGLAGEGNTT